MPTQKITKKSLIHKSRKTQRLKFCLLFMQIIKWMPYLYKSHIVKWNIGEGILKTWCGNIVRHSNAFLESGKGISISDKT